VGGVGGVGSAGSPYRVVYAPCVGAEERDRLLRYITLEDLETQEYLRDAKLVTWHYDRVDGKAFNHCSVGPLVGVPLP
jgi:hypothetical protein